MGRLITPTVRTTAPRLLVSVAWEPLDRQCGPTTVETRAGLYAVCRSVRNRSGWRPHSTAYVYPEDGDDLWHTLRVEAAGHHRPYLVTTCASDLLTLSGFWGRVERGEVSLRLSQAEYTDADGERRKRRPHPLILSGTPDVIGWEEDGSEWRAVSVSNHMPAPLSDVAKWLGIDPPAGVDMSAYPLGGAVMPADWTARVLLRAYQRYIDWWVGHNAGRWCDTTGSAAWQLWRSTIADESVLVHDAPGASVLELESVYGGRAELFWFGAAGNVDTHQGGAEMIEPAVPVRINEPIYKLDIRSMYGSILRDEPFPVAVRSRLHIRNPKQLLASEGRDCVIARVRVRLDSPRLPYHDHERGICYPIGEWVTTLCGPELFPAVRRGEVVGVMEAWSYKPGRPFERFADLLLGEREQARGSGDKFSEAVCKWLVNALGGRLARTWRGWTSLPDAPCPEPWGQWLEIDADTGEVVRYRGVCGVRQRYVTRDEREAGLCACYSYLTAYGRSRLADLIDCAGTHSVLWCDTDGLIVTESGVHRLSVAGHLGGDGPGRLRLVEPVRSFVGRTPKHYQTTNGLTLGGVRGDFSPLSRHEVRCYLSCNPVRVGERPDGDSLTTVSRLVRIDAIPLSSVPGPDGWAMPPRVSGGACEWPHPYHGDPSLDPWEC